MALLILVELVDEGVYSSVIAVGGEGFAEEAKVTAEEELVHSWQLAGSNGRGRMAPMYGAVRCGVWKKCKRGAVAKGHNEANF